MERMTPAKIRTLLEILDTQLVTISRDYEDSLKELVRIASETGQSILSVGIQHPAMTDLSITLNKIVKIFVEAERLKRLLDN